MEFIEFKEVYGVFLEGLWRPRQRANCGAVGGANRTPHVHDSFVGGQCGQIVEVWYIGFSDNIDLLHTNSIPALEDPQCRALDCECRSLECKIQTFSLAAPPPFE